MSGRRILTVARREVLQGFGQRSILISTAFTIVVLAAIVLLPDALGFGGASRTDVVTAPGAPAEVVRDARAAQEAFDVELDVGRAASDAAAQQAVRDGDADLAILAGGKVVAADGADAAALALLQETARRAQAAEVLRGAGVDEEVARRALDPPGLQVSTEDTGNGEAIAFIALLILYGQLIGYGFVVAMGIVEEKSSRVVEVLLSVLRPGELLLGKVLGLGVVGLAQLLVIAAAGLALGAGNGSIELDGEAWGALATVLAWFLLGYAFFSAAFAVGGALVPRQEDLQSVTTPLTIVLLFSFFLSFPALDDPDSAMAGAMSFVPFAAPLVMPVRMIAGDVAAWEVLLAIGSVAAGTALLVALAARVYRAGALETRAKISFSRALRAGSPG